MSFLGKIEPAQSVASDTARLSSLEDRLSAGIAPKLLPIYADIHGEILALAPPGNTMLQARRHAEILTEYCTQQSNNIAQLYAAEREFQTRIAHAIDRAEERAAVLDFVRAMGAGRKQLQSDRKAFDAYFDVDAAIERFHKRIGERERALAHALDRLGVIAAEAIGADPLLVDSAFFVDLSEGLLDDMRGWRGDARIRCAAHRCLAEIAAKIDHWPFGVWFESVLSATRRVCLDENEDAWVQCAAFDALMALSPGSIATALQVRFAAPLSAKVPAIADKELFLRRHIVRLIARNSSRSDGFAAALDKLAKDESGAVRQVFAGELHRLTRPAAARLFAELRGDSDNQVRAALFADVSLQLTILTPAQLAGHIGEILAQDEDEFVLRVALDAAAVLAARCHQTDGEDMSDGADIIRRIADHITAFRSRRISAKLLRWADETAERVWLISDPEAMRIAAVIKNITHDQREARIRPITALKPFLAQDSERVGRVMAVLSQNDFGLSLKPGRRPQIQRGEWIRRRLWRILFEGRHSATDKRQAHIHTTGRHYFGTMIAPSARMAELAPTKVPGEPQFDSSEGGWRNYLPLVDQVLTALDSGKTLRIFTSAGVTTLIPPKGLRPRLAGFWRITRTFADLADLRNRDPAEYLAALRALGIETGLKPYDPAQGLNPEIARFFDDGDAR